MKRFFIAVVLLMLLPVMMYQTAVDVIAEVGPAGYFLFFNILVVTWAFIRLFRTLFMIHTRYGVDKSGPITVLWIICFCIAALLVLIVPVEALELDSMIQKIAYQIALFIVAAFMIIGLPLRTLEF